MEKWLMEFLARLMLSVLVCRKKRKLDIQQRGPRTGIAVGRQFLPSLARSDRESVRIPLERCMMTIIEPPQAAVLGLEQTLLQALESHRDGKLEVAAGLYQSILQADPGHAVANHDLGALAVQMGQPAAGLHYFLAALETEPTRGQYWLSYIDALFQAGQKDDARQVLALARQQGLEGDDVDALALRLESGAGIGGPSSAVPTPARKVQRKERQPSRHEIDSLVTLFGEGRLADAMARAREMTVHFPSHWVGWKMLGVIFQQMGRNAEALLPMQKTVELSPRDAEAHNNLGIILKELGRLEESAASYRRALQIDGNYAQAHSNLGATLQQLGRLNEAEASYSQALRIDPNYAKAHDNLGAVLHDLKRLDEAEASYRRALHLNPDDAEVHRNLGIALKELGRLDEAEASVRRALTIDPRNMEAHCDLGTILFDSGRVNEAETCFRRTLELESDNFKAHNNLGAVLLDLGRPDEAEASLRCALAISPEFVEALSNLGISLRGLGRPEEAEASYRHALEIKPDSPDTLGNLGGVLHDLGRIEASVASYRRALEIDPDCARTHSNLLFCLSQIAETGAQKLFAEHCRFGAQFESRLRVKRPDFAGPRDPERSLRIGFVSGDFRNHAMAYFVEPVLAALSRFPRLSLHAYSNHAIEDAVTRRLRDCFAHWNSIVGLSDEAVAARVFGDGIDILIDLSGHTAMNRLPVFARKPAPVQASWMGYPGTTGLYAMDYYLADRLFLPVGQFDDQFTEKIVRLPASAPFLPSSNAPPINRLPALRNGHLTFGSFNRLSKFGPGLIALWSRLLCALPESRMLLGGMQEGERCDALIDWFAREGVVPERLEFHRRCDLDSYLALHHKVDICLDTYPYGGGTTTLHALWMGVPTLSLAGGTAAGRSGASILGHAGLEQFVAHNAAEFVEKGLLWSGKVAALAELRAGLRERLATSAIGQPALIAAALESVLRIMWQRWCAGLPPESFGVDRQTLAGFHREAGA
ncbi:MAG: tetratricopeptide repeat protein [Sulfuritalea sp.]|nr:tetratricopeptide repeat protein [Sulfuritalea sp.]